MYYDVIQKYLRSTKKIQCNDIGEKLYSHEKP